MESYKNCVICQEKGSQVYQGLEDKLFDTQGQYNIKKCSYCGLLWLDPRPSIAEAQKYYSDFNSSCYTKYPHGFRRRFLASLRDALREAILCGYYRYSHLHKRHYICKFGNLLGKMPLLRSRATYGQGEAFPFYSNKDSYSVLDVGCGDGNYLALLQAMGLRVWGIEPNHEMAGIAKKKGISVFDGNLKEAKLKDSSVDYVFMLHALEHMPDPLGEVNECFRVLKRGGKLVIRTPNAHSLGHSFFKNNWYGLDPPRHVFIFSPQSIRLIFKKNNFSKFKIRTLTCRSLTTFDNSTLIAWGKKIGGTDKINPQRGRYLFALKESLLVHFGNECGEEIELVAIK